MKIKHYLLVFLIIIIINFGFGFIYSPNVPSILKYLGYIIGSGLLGIIVFYAVFMTIEG